jgi:hypothetical protein
LKLPWRRQTAPDPNPAPSPSPGPALVWPTLATWASVVDATLLSEQTVKDAERFLQTYRRMTLPFRHASALRLREAIAAQVNPPPPATVMSMDVIAVALDARRKQLGQIG